MSVIPFNEGKEWLGDGLCTLCLGQLYLMQDPVRPGFLFSFCACEVFLLDRVVTYKPLVKRTNGWWGPPEWVLCTDSSMLEQSIRNQAARAHHGKWVLWSMVGKVKELVSAGGRWTVWEYNAYTGKSWSERREYQVFNRAPHFWPVRCVSLT